MKIDNLVPKPITKVQFRLAFSKLVPSESGCYVLATFDNDILYIGLATNLHNRFKNHLDNPEKTNPTNSGKAIWFYYTTFDPKNLPKLERTWLNQFADIHGQLPTLNKIYSTIS